MPFLRCRRALFQEFLSIALCGVLLLGASKTLYAQQDTPPPAQPAPEASAQPAPAQPAAAPIATPETTYAEPLIRLETEIARIKKALERAPDDKPTLDNLFNDANKLIKEAATIVAELEPKIKAATQKLEKLSPKAAEAAPTAPAAPTPPPAPAEPQPASGDEAAAHDKVQPPVEKQEEVAEKQRAEAVTRELETLKKNREAAEKQLALLAGFEGRARAVSVEAQQIAKAITQLRSQRFQNMVLHFSGSVFSLENLEKMHADLKSLGTRLTTVFNDSIAGANKNSGSHTLGLLISGVSLMLALLISLRSFARPAFSTLDTQSSQERVATSRALFRAAITGITLPLIPILPFSLLLVFGFIPSPLLPGLESIAFSLASFGFFYGFSREFTLKRGKLPTETSKTLVTIETRIRRLFLLIAFGTGLFVFWQGIEDLVYVLPDTRYTYDGLLLLVFLTFALLQFRLLSQGLKSNPTLRPYMKRLHSGVQVIMLFLLVGIGAIVTGYVPLVEFSLGLLMRLFAIYLVFRLTSRWLDPLAGDTYEAPVAQTLRGIFISAFIQLLVLVAGSIVVALYFGYNFYEYSVFFTSAFETFELGGVEFSLLQVVIAVGVFVLGIALTKALQRWLEERLLPTTKIDYGVRHSISTAWSYTGVIVAFFVAVSYAGFDLSSLAIVAGALSLGIGFGMQSIISNFVSGLILLIERPFKVGDWIVVGADEGIVKDIRVRATEIETFEHATVIIPNSSLISSPVKNWFLNDHTGRVSLLVGVAYGSDPEKVRDILMTCAEAHPDVLAYPPPKVHLLNFGASSLDFRLDVFLAECTLCVVTGSDLRFAVLKAFKEHGITIPFPHQEVIIRKEFST